MKLSEVLEGRNLTNRVTVPVLLNTDTAERIIDAERAVKDATRRLEFAEQQEAGLMAQPATTAAREELSQAQAALAAAQADAEDHLYDFVVESIGAAAWQELVSAHPPTKEQRERLGRDLDYNPDTFPVAALAVCLVDPEADTVEEVQDLKAKLPQAVWQQLWTGCLRANIGVNRVPPSLTGSHATSGSGPKSGQQSI